MVKVFVWQSYKERANGRDNNSDRMCNNTDRIPKQHFFVGFISMKLLCHLIYMCNFAV